MDVISDTQTRTTSSSSPRRQQVIDAAAATFSRLSYHGASTRTIADALGIKVASLYFHIASKEDALAEICMIGTERSRAYLRAALEQAATLDDQVRHFFQYQSEGLHTHADYVSVSIREGRNLSAEARKVQNIISKKFRAELDAMFAQAAERRELHPAISPREARFIMIGTMRSLSELYISGAINDFEAVRHAWVESIIRGLTCSR